MGKKYVPCKGLGTSPRLVVFSCKNFYFIVLHLCIVLDCIVRVSYQMDIMLSAIPENSSNQDRMENDSEYYCLLKTVSYDFKED